VGIYRESGGEMSSADSYFIFAFIGGAGMVALNTMFPDYFQGIVVVDPVGTSIEQCERLCEKRRGAIVHLIDSEERSLLFKQSKRI
jgi:hypothetical protein